MDLVSKSYLIHISSNSLSPISAPQISSLNNPSHSGNSFPIIAIAIIGILSTAFLLVSYYIFVIKCCLNWHRIDLFARFSLSRRRQDPLMVYSVEAQTRGLDDSVIRSIPIFQFKKEESNQCYFECAVCLNEFLEDEKLRIIPNCSHVFHIDCIDVWLQGNPNCPLCRASISFNPTNQTIGPSSSPQDPTPYSENVIDADEDFVVIEISKSDSNSGDERVFGRREKLSSGESSGKSVEKRGFMGKNRRKFSKTTSMGDECIDIREKNEQFSIQPIRRSFSMDSSADRQMYLAIQEAVQMNRNVNNEVSVSPIEGCSNRIRRSFFSFGHGRGSRSAVLPVYLEP